MTFEEKRSYITHTLLANGFFFYLCQPPDLWKTALNLQEQKIQELCLSWDQVKVNPKLIIHAAKTWRGERPGESSVQESVIALYHLCWNGKYFRPKNNFPEIKEVNNWLDDMEFFINLAVPISGGVSEVKISTLRTFWHSGLTLYNFLQTISIGSPKFLEFFEVM